MSDGLYGRNYDFAPDRYDGLLAAIQPDNVYASIGFTDRITGRDDGMNEHGLCVGLHHVNEMNWQPGLVCILIVRIVLDQCATTREAVDLLKRLPHGLGFNYSLLDANHNSAVVEASPTGVAVRLGAICSAPIIFKAMNLNLKTGEIPALFIAWRRLKHGDLLPWAKKRCSTSSTDQIHQFLSAIIPREVAHFTPWFAGLSAVK